MGFRMSRNCLTSGDLYGSKVNGGQPDIRKFEVLCLKYGTEKREIINKSQVWVFVWREIS